MADVRRWHIYALLDPETLLPRYVGWSFYPGRRLRAHINQAKGGAIGHKANWLRSVLSRGAEPMLFILESGFGDYEEAERRWIRDLRLSGTALTNATDGGEGAPGFCPSEETRARMSAARTGRKMPASAIAKTAAALRGRKQSATHVAALAATRRGKAPLAATAAARLVNLGKKQSAEVVAGRMAGIKRRAGAEFRKLDDESVRIIRSGFYTNERLAWGHGVSVSTIDAIKHRRRYVDVPDLHPDDIKKLFGDLVFASVSEAESSAATVNV